MQIDLFDQQTKEEYEQRFKRFYRKQLADKERRDNEVKEDVNISLSGVVRPMIDIINEFRNGNNR